MKPRLVVLVELEELPRVRLEADSHEDERRLVAWLENQRTRRRLQDALEDAVDAFAEEAA